MSEGGKIEMDDDECTEEYPEENMDRICYLNASDKIDDRTEEIWIPQEKTCYYLDRNKSHHNHEI